MEVQEKERTEMSDTYLLTEHIYQHFVAESQTLFLHQLEAFLNEVSFYFF